MKTHALLVALALVASCAAPVAPTTDAGPSAPVALAAPVQVVVPTFDDTFAEQYTVVLPALRARGMKGTFFVNSSRLGSPGYMTAAQVLEMQAAGMEVGGHTLSHPHLPALSPADQATEVCGDRANLLALGIDAQSFAYPFGDDVGAHPAVASCYPRARDIGGANNLAGFCGSAPSCTTCAYAEAVPPRDQLAIRTAPTSVGPAVAGATCDRMDVVAAVQGARAYPVGPLVVNWHHVCDGCDPGSPTLIFKPAEFTAVLDWMVATGVQTRTLREAFP